MKEEKEIQLFVKAQDCCGCGACMNVCPQGAIEMREDKFGFMYPVIDKNKCVNCGLCKKVCSYQNGTNMYDPQNSFVSVNQNEKQLQKSASGGMFAAIASVILEEGGVVFGAAYVREEDKLQVRHVGITSIDELYRLQGSKYVQSAIEFSYKEVKKYLEEGRKVLFSGTPCQVAGLRGYLRKDYNNLHTIDLVCHGVPNLKLFNEYIKYLEKKEQGKIVEFNFRDKARGWADYFIQYVVEKNGKTVTKDIHCRMSAYYEFFLGELIFRENCYSCKYACGKRVGDITIGDYWGIENVHRELFQEKKWRERRYSGISCTMVNTEKGKKLLEMAKNKVELVESDFEKTSKENGQLRLPSQRPSQREEVLQLFIENGYEAVQNKFDARLGKKRYVYKIKSCVPLGLKKNIKELMFHLKK